ncbi:MAG: putative phosphoesterase [Geminicoccaceae bacterium]|jgi:predicted phosphodiesterase|nr:putative phosphoesterase [Geminicoccaceae bacterium]
MRLAVISDVHGNLLALETVLADIRSRAPDVIVNLGDCVTSPLWPRETLELLDTLSLPTVRGNHDRWIAQSSDAPDWPSVVFSRNALTARQRATLGALPPTLDVAERVLAVHGTPTSDTAYLLEDKIDGRLALAPAATVAERLGDVTAELVLCGHSHTQHVATVGPNRLVLNPGSVGLPRYAGNADAAMNEAGSPHARYAIATRRAGRWSVELFALAYEWDAVADRAARNGRAEFGLQFLGTSRDD